VRVTVPHRLKDDAVRAVVIGKLEWIRQHQMRVLAAARVSARDFVTGETHEFFGKQLPIRVVEGKGRARIVEREDSGIDLMVRPGATRAERERTLQRWYRKELEGLIPTLVARWEGPMGVKVAEWGVKRMKTKWGTCNTRARRIWISLELAKKPIRCLEYIVVHEMTHLLERSHNHRFKGLMDGFMPEWRLIQRELKQLDQSSEGLE
jgi:hypothetical protein